MVIKVRKGRMGRRGNVRMGERGTCEKWGNGEKGEKGRRGEWGRPRKSGEEMEDRRERGDR